MNFFGHAHVAIRESASPAFVIGSMLPDFASMVGCRIASVDAGALADGVAHHHHTDALFHASETFVDFQRRSCARLDAAGVRWGTARAVAHVGVELLLDGELTQLGDANDAYLAALEAEASAALSSVRWRGDDGSQAVRGLLDRLRAHGVPHDYGDVAVVLDRLTRVLARRTRLAIEPGAADAVRSELTLLSAEVQSSVEGLVP